MMEKYCFDCVNWNPDSPETNYCDHEKTEAFQQYMEDASESEKFDALKCPGFEDIENEQSSTVVSIETRIRQEKLTRFLKLESLVMAKDFVGTLNYLEQTIDDKKYGIDFGVSIPSSYMSTLSRVSNEDPDPATRESAKRFYYWFGSLLASTPKFQSILHDYFVFKALEYDKLQDQ